MLPGLHFGEKVFDEDGQGKGVGIPLDKQDKPFGSGHASLGLSQ